MKTLKGIGASNGIARGVAYTYRTESESEIPHYPVLEDNAESEIARVQKAFEKSREEMRKMIEKSKSLFDPDAVNIFNAHLVILEDKELLGKILDLITLRLINAEHAVADAFDEYIEKYRSSKGHFKELVHDFIDTRDALLASFSDKRGGFECFVEEGRPIIVATKRLTPSMVLAIPKERVLAFISSEGGLTGHGTILARSYGVPVVLGIKVDEEISCGINVIVDGTSGKVIKDPDEKTLTYYDKRLEVYQSKRVICEIKKGDFAKTKKGMSVKLRLNISTPEEFSLLKGVPHDGIGLLRTEFLFIQKSFPPDEDIQVEVYKKFLDTSEGTSVAIRLLDIGADKVPPYLDIPKNQNIDMGLRGAVAAEKFSEIYITQLKALLRANAKNNLNILYPMVSDLNDLDTFRELLAEAKRQLKIDKLKNIGAVKEGIMIETPAAVMMIGELLNKVDFVNIGSNDLLQYTLAGLRGDPLVEKRYHIFHPAIARLMEIIIKEAAKAGKEVCLCGEIASFPSFYPLFLKMGLRSFSVAVSKFDEIKCGLLDIDESAGEDILENYYKYYIREDIDRYFERFL